MLTVGHVTAARRIHVGDRDHTGAVDPTKRAGRCLCSVTSPHPTIAMRSSCFVPGKLYSSSPDSHIIASVSNWRIARDTFDYIVVGGGTAGCIVAARLAEEPGCTVAVIESGGPYRRILDVPLIGLWAWLRRPDRYCWTPSTAPQPGLDGRRLWFPAGRLHGRRVRRSMPWCAVVGIRRATTGGTPRARGTPTSCPGSCARNEPARALLASWRRWAVGRFGFTF